MFALDQQDAAEEEDELSHQAMVVTFLALVVEHPQVRQMPSRPL